MSAVYKDDQEDWLTVCLKYLLFVFNFLFWVSESCKCSPLFLICLHSQKPLQWLHFVIYLLVYTRNVVLKQY